MKGKGGRGLSSKVWRATSVQPHAFSPLHFSPPPFLSPVSHLSSLTTPTHSISPFYPPCLFPSHFRVVSLFLCCLPSNPSSHLPLPSPCHILSLLTSLPSLFSLSPPLLAPTSTFCLLPPTFSLLPPSMSPPTLCLHPSPHTFPLLLALSPIFSSLRPSLSDRRCLSTDPPSPHPLLTLPLSHTLSLLPFPGAPLFFLPFSSAFFFHLLTAPSSLFLAPPLRPSSHPHSPSYISCFSTSLPFPALLTDPSFASLHFLLPLFSHPFPSHLLPSTSSSLTSWPALSLSLSLCLPPPTPVHCRNPSSHTPPIASSEPSPTAIAGASGLSTNVTSAPSTIATSFAQ
ncbi:uncharacterized protein LOC128773851 [Panthera pardus]|uniref:Uncharacterized protein LOC128773851 n=1 Tax=Panthera pardus TaxID=9691 RepID=A0A9W2UN99_PANPR|nr:uncharacterized protein LOC128773851 [Panthera pardus]